jgi:hypothetical protein
MLPAAASVMVVAALLAAVVGEGVRLSLLQPAKITDASNMAA